MRWIWLAVLVACGDNVVPRLQPVTYELDGVTYTQPGLFHDRARDEQCTSMRWGDGATYCTPAIAATAYADSNCSQPVAMASSGYAATMSTIGTETTVHRLRAVAARAALAQYWLANNGACSGPYPAAADSAWGDIVGDELDESAFVRLFRSVPEGSGRLQIIAWNTIDGTHVPRALYDRELDSECNFIDARDRDRVACAPTDVLDADFGDASCSEPVVIAAGAAPAFARVGCDRYARVGDAITSAVYTASSSGCQAKAVPAGWQVYAVGSAVDLAYATRERQGSARMQPIELVAGTARVADGLVYDEMLDADCALAPYAGAVRCVPAAVAVSTYFADAMCMEERDVALIKRDACGAAERFAFRDAYHAVGPVVTDALYVPSTGDRCMVQPPDDEPHAIGPALPPETFVPAL